MNSASSEAQEQYSSEDDNGDLPTTEINTEKKQDDFGISKQIKGCWYYKHSADTNYGMASVTEPSGESRIPKCRGCTTRIEDHYWGIMKDFMEVLLNPDPQDSFLGIFDGHGGPEAGDFARNHLWHP